uniref:Citrate transporter-like domain-containing protein n=1 Tax=Chromera velia CCMP2878 TaxID=1169474 RepID=A0A0G4FKB5_9ALVE|eukprot:Cvel_17321.t1-p1 / transcript=Cvel_17321.t1 / gene=Cvel_17321 / organism=Chromera_velia_CCMP2878 / gene_product=Putative sulfur deprivation response regulator, putative / transcript_product=Putative sulfur deprivation response regulator, putative / location=Cvel_scaffold1375:35502-46111(+) / protein_length=1189 / sequence_SO=supercontig / SO=protein_coding / is_pseudo=false
MEPKSPSTSLPGGTSFFAEKRLGLRRAFSLHVFAGLLAAAVFVLFGIFVAHLEFIASREFGASKVRAGFYEEKGGLLPCTVKAYRLYASRFFLPAFRDSVGPFGFGELVNSWHVHKHRYRYNGLIIRLADIPDPLGLVILEGFLFDQQGNLVASTKPYQVQMNSPVHMKARKAPGGDATQAGLFLGSKPKRYHGNLAEYVEYDWGKIDKYKSVGPDQIFNKTFDKHRGGNSLQSEGKANANAMAQKASGQEGPKPPFPFNDDGDETFDADTDEPSGRRRRKYLQPTKPPSAKNHRRTGTAPVRVRGGEEARAKFKKELEEMKRKNKRENIEAEGLIEEEEQKESEGKEGLSYLVSPRLTKNRPFASGLHDGKPEVMKMVEKDNHKRASSLGGPPPAGSTQIFSDDSFTTEETGPTLEQQLTEHYAPLRFDKAKSGQTRGIGGQIQGRRHTQRGSFLEMEAKDGAPTSSDTESEKDYGECFSSADYDTVDIRLEFDGARKERNLEPGMMKMRAAHHDPDRYLLDNMKDKEVPRSLSLPARMDSPDSTLQLHEHEEEEKEEEGERGGGEAKKNKKKKPEDLWHLRHGVKLNTETLSLEMMKSIVTEQRKDQPGSQALAVTYDVILPSWKGYAVWALTLVALALTTEGVPTEFVMLGLIVVIQETALLDRLFRYVLASPRTEVEAHARIAVPVIVLSAVFSNTVTVSVMIPVLMSWCSKLGVHPSRVMMPVAFYSQLGGCLTVMGSSANMACVSVMPSAIAGSEEYRMSVDGTVKLGMYDDDEDDLHLDLFSLKRTEKTHLEFHMLFYVDNSCQLIGQTIDHAGLHRMRGIRLLGVSSEDGEVIFPPEPYTPEVAREAMDTIMFEPGDVVKLAVLATSLNQLRRISGFRLSMYPLLERVGGKRRHRCLAQVAVPNQCPLLRHPIHQMHMYEMFGLVVLAVRRTEGPPPCQRDFENFQLLPGDILLCEAETRILKEPPPEFSLVAPVPNSKPPRVGRFADRVRAWLVMALLVLVLVSAWVITKLQSHLACLYMLIVFLYILMRACNYEEVYHSLNGPILVTVGAAFGVAAAFRESGAATAVADWLMLVSRLLPESIFGPLGVYLGIYVTVTTLCAVNQISCFLVLLFSANCAFTTPFGYQTNMMVLPYGCYSFFDYLRFGFPLNCCMLPVVLTAVRLRDLLPELIAWISSFWT